MTIDYARAKREMPALKAALTRAKKKGPEAVLAEVERAFAAFDSWGCWPDSWHTWNIAKSDAELALRYSQW